MNPLNEQLYSLLHSIEGNGSFYTQGIYPFVLPGLKLKNVGEINFPIKETQAISLIENARRAPFGKGSETIVDTSVRSVWEISPDQFSFENPQWNTVLDEILDEVRGGLGMEEKDISYSFYKMLIYEQGDFFLPHKDLEKEEGMFGTLIISLPSAHIGGTLNIQHNGKEAQIKFDDKAYYYELPYVAFYADCLHEVQPITSGYRICLVYNLIQVNSTNTMSSPSFLDQESQITELFNVWKKEELMFPKAIVLEHEYTPTNFSRQALKLHDIPRVEVLLAAAERAEYIAMLGLVTHYQTGQVEDYDYSYSNRYGYSNNKDLDSVEMGEIFEEYTEISLLPYNNIPTLGTIRVDENSIEEQILTDKDFLGGDPSESDIDDYTGNHSMTISYWYHYGAVVLWPTNAHLDLLTHQPIKNQLEWIHYYLSTPKLNEEEFLRLLENICSYINSEEPLLYRKEVGNYNILAQAIVHIKNTFFLIESGLPALEKKFDKIDTNNWLKLVQTYSSNLFMDLFSRIGNSGNFFYLHRLINMCKAITQSYDTTLQPIQQTILTPFPAYLAMSEMWKMEIPKYASYQVDIQSVNATKLGVIADLFHLSKLSADKKDWLHELALRIMGDFNRSYLNSIIGQAILKAHDFTSPLFLVLKHLLVEDLQKRVNTKPSAPTDLQREIPKHDPFYADEWEFLTPFMRSKKEGFIDYKKRQEDRTKMMNAITRTEADLTYETIKIGSPHTLRITKTQASYRKALINWTEDKALLLEINTLSQNLSPRTDD